MTELGVDILYQLSLSWGLQATLLLLEALFSDLRSLFSCSRILDSGLALKEFLAWFNLCLLDHQLLEQFFSVKEAVVNDFCCLVDFLEVDLVLLVRSGV